MRVVRELAYNLFTNCSLALAEGLAIQRVQNHYIRRTNELVDEAEAQAILATEGSADAVRAIQGSVNELRALADALARERGQAAGADPDA